MYDLHTHSDFSDGVLPPEKLIEEAKAKGFTLFALTDHDTVGGIVRAAEAAARLRVPFIPGIEISAEYPCELHILGLGVDIASPSIKRLEKIQEKHRFDRNERVLKLLADAGIDAQKHLDKERRFLTKADIASAMVSERLADSVNDAFARWLRKGRQIGRAHV